MTDNNTPEIKTSPSNPSTLKERLIKKTATNILNIYLPTKNKDFVDTPEKKHERENRWQNLKLNEIPQLSQNIEVIEKILEASFTANTEDISSDIFPQVNDQLTKTLLTDLIVGRMSQIEVPENTQKSDFAKKLADDFLKDFLESKKMLPLPSSPTQIYLERWIDVSDVLQAILDSPQLINRN